MPDNSERGYGKPPKEHRFKKDVSGNPAGRPKGSKNKRTDAFADRITDIVLAEANREIEVKDNGKVISVPVTKAVMRSLATNALKGVTKAQQLFFEISNAAAKHKDQRAESVLQSVLEYKDKWRRAFEQCDAEGIPRPDIVPHPDDLYVHPETGDVFLLGPMTHEQREQERRERLAEIRREAAESESEKPPEEGPEE